jgi:hypothetical protein
MKLSERIESASIQELAKIAKGLMDGNGPKLLGHRVWFSYDDAKSLILKHRPEIDYSEVDEILGLEIGYLGNWTNL